MKEPNFPALDRKTDRLYAVFDRGEVVCLEGSTGKLVWETVLCENPYPGWSVAWSAIALQKDVIVAKGNR